MTRSIHILIVLLFVSIMGCNPAPDEVYRQMLASAQIGYEDGFVEGFSKKSRTIVRALLRLADVYGFESRNPLTLLDADDAVAAEIHGDAAIVTVHRGSFERQVLFIQDPDDDDNWRVDLSEYEKFLAAGTDGYLENRNREKGTDK